MQAFSQRHSAWMFPNVRPFFPLTASPYIPLVDVLNNDNLTAFVAKISHLLFTFVSVHNHLPRFSILATH